MSHGEPPSKKLKVNDGKAVAVVTAAPKKLMLPSKRAELDKIDTLQLEKEVAELGTIYTVATCKIAVARISKHSRFAVDCEWSGGRTRPFELSLIQVGTSSKDYRDRQV